MTFQVHTYLKPFLVAAIFISAFAPPAFALRARAYDLDSLICMSSDIVEARLVESASFAQPETRVEIERCFKGDFQTNQVVAIDYLNFYRGIQESEPLRVGTDVFLLLIRKGRETPFSGGHWPESTNPVTLANGVRIVVGGRVFRFAQPSNPGPLVVHAGYDEDFPAPTVDEFRRMLPGRIASAETLAYSIQSAGGSNAVSTLVRVLKSRATPDDPWYSHRALPCALAREDRLAEEAANKLVAINDLPSLANSISVNLPYAVNQKLLSGLRAESAQTFLRSFIADKTASASQRIEALSAFHANLDLNSIELAQNLTSDDELCGHLLSQMFSSASRSIESNELINARFAEWDLMKRRLIGLYESTTSDAIRGSIEMFLAKYDRPAQQELDSNCGPVVGVASRDEPTRCKLPLRSSLNVNVTSVLLDEDPRMTVILVLTHNLTQREYELVELPYSNTTRFRMSRLPNLDPGTYHVWAKFRSRPIFYSTENRSIGLQRVVKVGQGVASTPGRRQRSRSVGGAATAAARRA